MSSQEYDAVVVGAGFAGSVVARELAERGRMRVLLVERRSHVGGNAYDLKAPDGILYHLYGPHIFHTSDKRVYEYLSRFTRFSGYEHRVLADVHGTYLPVPFNKRSIRIVYGEKRGQELIDKLVAAFGEGARVPIGRLRETSDPDLHELAGYVYENIFLHYTTKQWGVAPDEVDPSVTARVPVLVSEDDRYFQDAYQGMPDAGYTALFDAMLDCPGITVRLDTPAADVLSLLNADGVDLTAQAAPGRVERVLVDGEPFAGPVVFTGAVDELLCRREGALPYRSLRFELEELPVERHQPAATVNYTVSEEFTRITEWKQLTGQEVPGVTLITREYPQAYEPDAGMDPYYPVISSDNAARYDAYASAFQGVPGFHLLGRLAEYRYYNMDAIVGAALALADRLVASHT